MLLSNQTGLTLFHDHSLELSMLLIPINDHCLVFGVRENTQSSI